MRTFRHLHVSFRHRCFNYDAIIVAIENIWGLPPNKSPALCSVHPTKVISYTQSVSYQCNAHRLSLLRSNNCIHIDHFISTAPNSSCNLCWNIALWLQPSVTACPANTFSYFRSQQQHKSKYPMIHTHPQATLLSSSALFTIPIPRGTPCCTCPCSTHSIVIPIWYCQLASIANLNTSSWTASPNLNKIKKNRSKRG